MGAHEKVSLDLREEWQTFENNLFHINMESQSTLLQPMGIPHGHKRKKNFRAGRGHAGRVGGGKAHQLAARQWNSNKGNNKHLYSSLESAKNVYTPFRLEKVNIWVG